MKVELTKEDWDEAKKSTESLIKNSMAQLVIYKGQLKTAERELRKIEKKSKKLAKYIG